MISAKDEVGGYVTLEFTDIKVRADRIDWSCLFLNHSLSKILLRLTTC